MAPRNSFIFPTKSSMLFLLLVSFIYSASSLLLTPTTSAETKITLYLQASFTGPNANFVRVAGIPGNRWSFADFATLFVVDASITESLSPNSPIIARSQGLFSISSLDASTAFTTFSVVFINSAYAGSTLEINGRFSQNANVSELSIASGTGKFRFAKGYDVVTPIVFNSTNLLARGDITVRLN